MKTEELKVQVDAGARIEAITAKIKELRERGFQLLEPEPLLPDGSRVESAMTLTFRRTVLDAANTAGEFSGPQAGIVIGGGTFENISSGAGLSAGPL